MLVIDVNEKIILEEKTPKEENETEIENNINNIITNNNNKKKEKKLFLYFTSFKPENMEYIWKG